MAFKLFKKKTASEETLSEENKALLISELDKDHKKFGSKYAIWVYICQSVAFFALALAIPQAFFNKEWTLLIFLAIGAVALLFPFVYMASESEYWKQIKKIENTEVDVVNTPATNAENDDSSEK